MSHPLVSIIIPTYNSKAYVQEAAASALSQKYKSIEIIVVDDGSTDDTRDLFPEFEAKGIRCFYIDNGGASNARNYGLEKSSGDYIQFLDADDILEPTKIEKQLNLMRLHKADLCYSPWVIFENDISDAHKQFRFSYLDHSLKRTGQEIMISYGMDNWFILTVAWLVKKDLIEKAGFWNPAKCPNDDGEYFSRALFWSEHVVCCNEVLSFYRKTANDSLSKLNSETKIEASYKSFKQIESLLLTCRNDKLMSYPKRMFYMQYKLVKSNYPDLAKRAAKNFDRINAPSFLSDKIYYWWFINRFGLYTGTKLYTLLKPIWGLLKRN
ncbi:glycosyltransferase family 2 protein [Psychroserpens burtonensis]|uniref:Glycosyltransferase family 2 protein n=1 Tax=Psychroserpens burtonensis TaxID=49278 RepID=A0A5C7BAI6_9FLAO|nr:glycosyltransferase family 2 protein [Psychroserpens burtonensis]TXE17124.1 glycosyltransferase family 2 protein [Psychroserpens burtonensis]